MRTTEHGEICISNDNQTIGEEGFYLKRKGEEREQTDGETERERACVCVCVGRRRRFVKFVKGDLSDSKYSKPIIY
jgi:hypothetical protein